MFMTLKLAIGQYTKQMKMIRHREGDRQINTELIYKGGSMKTQCSLSCAYATACMSAYMGNVPMDVGLPYGLRLHDNNYNYNVQLKTYNYIIIMALLL